MADRDDSKTIVQELGIIAEKLGKDAEAGLDEKSSSNDTLSIQQDVPEGGLQGWATVLGAFCVQFCCFGYTASFGVYQDFYVREYITNQTPSTISWIGSVNAFIGIAGSLLAGQLYDRGYFKHCIYGGSLMLPFSLFMLSLAKPNQFYQIFLAQAVCAGIGAGLLYVPSIAVISHYFIKKRTLAMSIVASGSSLGSIIHPIMVNYTLNSKLGFGGSTRANAGLISVMLLIAIFLMKPRLPPSKSTVAFIPAVKKFAKDKAYVCATLGLLLFNVGFYYPLYFIQLDATVHGLNKEFAFYSLVILNSGQLIGRLFIGFAAHKFGIAPMLTITSGVCSAVIFGMIGLKSVTSVVLIGLFFGIPAGAYLALNAPLLAALTDDFAEIGLRMGVGFAISAIGGLVGSPIQGALLTEKYIWWKPAVFSGIIAYAGFGFFVAMQLLMRNRKIHGC